MKHAHNMGGLDRLGRLVAGLALLAAGLFGALATGWQVAALAAATPAVGDRNRGLLPRLRPVRDQHAPPRRAPAVPSRRAPVEAVTRVLSRHGRGAQHEARYSNIRN
jgi:hypothetical protein